MGLGGKLNLVQVSRDSGCCLPLLRPSGLQAAVTEKSDGYNTNILSLGRDKKSSRVNVVRTGAYC